MNKYKNEVAHLDCTMINIISLFNWQATIITDQLGNTTVSSVIKLVIVHLKTVNMPIEIQALETKWYKFCIPPSNETKSL